MEQEDKRTVGQLLRAAREALGISREEAAAVTRIKPVFLAALEEDDYHLLPDERYLLRFLEEYARFLNVDARTVQDRFSEQIARDPGSLVVFPVKRTITVPLRGLVPALLLLAVLIPS
ncbi:MAG: helix-turn-helix domain-containing protein, partial [Candidatus Methylomirabilales bacterium]